MSTPLTPDAVEAIKKHMNDDHADDALLIVRALGGKPGATSARTTGVDAEAIYFEADGEPVTVKWSAPIEERAQVRKEVVVLYRRACEILGVEARGH
ncbi:DUF2470 domain-containing protein [Herbidospora sp. NBRC 101105]|uniref:DUF2470 domain-containing protein n=1 Tax=Herbidospora sp. NBRC 101105 TaxID=3032195 RepID=UPI0024A4A3B0|nr:DUF2470 domain-containing protein [Herbidospora sp. NBRC 101105]GLX95844.1 hypothetical protein Hesp01_37940 [Herbidospora sp. NBRC 101105]